MKKKPTTKLIDALSARTHFGEIMEKAEKENLRFLVSRRGKPKVVILGVEDYFKNVIKQPKILTKIQISSQKKDLFEMTKDDIDIEIDNYRESKK